MQESIDELYARWQTNPDAARTAALCDALQGSNRADLVEIVGPHAARQLDVDALVAAARMYTRAGRLEHAQEILVAAGRLAPRNGAVFRWLGEVLLRRGDAERAEKVLERAVQFAPTPEASAWLERARSLIATQKASGMTIVAEAIATEDKPLPAGDALQTANVELPPASSGAAALPNKSVTAPLPPPMPPHFAPAPAWAPLDALAREAPTNPFSATVAENPVPVSNGRRAPEPRDVLDALQIAGIFEPDGAVRPLGWERAHKARRSYKSIAALVTLAVAIVGGAAGTFTYVKDKRAKQHVQAESVLATVDTQLRASDASLLEPAEAMLRRAFELESRSPHAALTWLHERAMLGLLKGGESLAFEDATERAKEVGVPERNIAFARVASFLFQGDTAGAAAAIAKWERVADHDPWFELIAGATFERAGDTRSIERYAAASTGDPELFVAQVLHARATAVDGDPRQAIELAKALQGKHPERLEGKTLLALAWARDPMRGDAPAEVKEVLAKDGLLPRSLQAVPHATRALVALDAHRLDEAKPALQAGLSLADTPGIAAWLGSIALVTGDEALARKAALAAVSFSAVYPPARILAARVALLGARLDEALKAAEELPAASPDVAVVTAAVAYEKLDGDLMARAFEAMADDAKRLPFLQPLARGRALLAGTLPAMSADKALELSSDEAPWADLVAMDGALDAGDLDLAGRMASAWNGDVRSLRATRLARLARYQGKLEDAERLSRIALESGTVTVRALAERVFTLVAAGKPQSATALFKTYPNVGGPLAKWLRAYAIASGGKVDDARALISQEDPPPAASSMPARMVAAAAFGASRDQRRGADYVKAIVQAGFVNPDVSAAADKLGAAKPARRR